MKWHRHFFRLANEIAACSKDPKRKVGCVVIDKHRNILASGYNGFARHVADDERLHDVNVKLQLIVHAEANAVAAAARLGHSLLGGTAYVTRPVCSQCASLLIQAGVVQVFCLSAEQNRVSKWQDNWAIAQSALQEAGVYYKEIDLCDIERYLSE